MFAWGQCRVVESMVVQNQWRWVKIYICSHLIKLKIQIFVMLDSWCSNYSQMWCEVHLVMLCCLRNQAWVWPEPLLWRPILGFWGFTENTLSNNCIYWLIPKISFYERIVSRMQPFGPACTYYLSLSAAWSVSVCLCGGLYKWVCLCGLSVYVMTFFSQIMLKWLHNGMRHETFLQKVFHRSNQHPGERELIKI